MKRSFRSALIGSLGFAAAGTAFLPLQAIAGPAESRDDQQIAEAPADLIINAENPPAPGEIAQTYIAPVSEDVEDEFQPETGWYIGIGAGAAWPIDQHFDGDVDDIRNFPDLDYKGDINYGGGFSGDVAVGYDFGAIRTELSYVYTNADINDVTSLTIKAEGNRFKDDFDASGNIDKHDVFLSAYWDIDTGSRWTPYLGGGVGWTHFNTGRIKVAGETVVDDASKDLFGWQAKLGVSYAMAYNWDVYLEGTYSGASGFYDDDNDVSYDSYNDFGAKLGFRYRFGSPKVVVIPEPEPEPMPEPAPEPMPMPEPEPAPIRGLW